MSRAKSASTRSTLAPAFALAIGAARHDAAEPLDLGLSKGWRGRIAFQALRGALPGGSELRPVSGVLKSDGQSLTLRCHQGQHRRRRGERHHRRQTEREWNCLECAAFNSATSMARRCTIAASRCRQAAPPLQMTLTSQGRSASALTGALSGSGTVTLESAAIAGLDPRAFEVAIRASDSGQATDDAKLKQIVEPVLSGRRAVGRIGANPVQHPRRPASRRRDDARCQGRARHRIGRIRHSRRPGRHPRQPGVDGGGMLRASRPEIQLFAVGSPDALDRSVDVAALSSWLAVRAIDRETRRLDAIERGEPPPPLPAAIPPVVPQPPALVPAPRPRVAPAPAPVNPSPPVTSQQVAPLPPPIEVRPAPGVVKQPPKPRPPPPLVLTPPPAANPR